MEVKKYDKIVLDSTRSIDDIVAGIKAELSKQESENAGESYICYVSHAYSSGENAGVNYIVVSDEFKRLNRLSSNVIQANAYTKEEINELIARVEAQIPVDEANLATKEELNEINSTLTDAINTINTKANADAVVNLTDNQTIEGVKTFSAVPVVASQPTDDNQLANKAYIDGINTTLTRSINTKANANATVNLTGNQTIAGVKTFSAPVVVPNATDNTHAVNLAQLNTKATKLLTENLVKTVGASGADFVNLRQALEWASQYSYSGGIYSITLRCNADIPIPGTYLPVGEANIIIDGQNNSFNCNNEYFMTFAISTLSAGGNIGNILIKNFTLNYNNITSNAYGSAFQATGINVTLNNITININNSNIGNSLIVNQAAMDLLMENVTINCNGNSNINIVVMCNGANLGSQDLVVNTMNLSGQIQSLFYFNHGTANLHQYSSEKPPYPTDKIVTQINLYGGSTVFCGNRFNDSKLSIAPNTLTSAGIIFKS